MRVTPMSHNQFLFELPSRQEVVRVHAGDWFWNGWCLSLQWWSAVACTEIACQKYDQIWIKAFGIPVHAWKLDTFRTIGDLCGGFIGIYEGTKHRSHYLWARICVSNSGAKCPDKIELEVDYWRHEISILKDVAATPKPVRKAGEEGLGISSIKATVNLGNGVDSLVKSQHVEGHINSKAALDRQLDIGHFNSKISGPLPGLINSRAKQGNFIIRPNEANNSDISRVPAKYKLLFKRPTQEGLF